MRSNFWAVSSKGSSLRRVVIFLRCAQKKSQMRNDYASNHYRPSSSKSMFNFLESCTK